MIASRKTLASFTVLMVFPVLASASNVSLVLRPDQVVSQIE